MTKVLSLTNQKGGVGKTTTAVNLAAALGEAGQKVLLIDFDPQGNSTSGLVTEISDDQPTAYEMICGNKKASECIIEGASENVDLIPANIDLSAAEIEFVEIENRYMMLKDVIKPIKKNYDYIFVDCPPSLGILTVNSLAASDGAIIPVQCEYYALEGLNQVLNTIYLVKQKMNPSLKVEGVLFTMYDPRTNLSRQVVDSVKDSLNENVFETVIPRNVRLAEAPSFGQPITAYDPTSRGAESYRMLAAEIIRQN